METPYQIPSRKRIPYGMMNFADVRERDCYFVDKTSFIPLIEQANCFFFFIRPRRFGKSLTLMMLQHYYDILDKDHFEQWFGDLYIGKHPTPERNSYLVISLDFASINAELNSYRASLDDYCRTMFSSFCRRYADYLPAGTWEELREIQGAVGQLSFLHQRCAECGLSVYLFIDEYDHFTNKILADSDCLNDYKSETHGTGYLRTFFDAIKTGTKGAIKRVFITGVSPVTMDDVTSGFNIGTNYSLSPEFNELTGFTEEEVRAMLDYYAEACAGTPSAFHHTTDQLIEKMKPWYDNYCFAKQNYGRTTMYNSTMVLYFLDNYIRNGGQLPDKMLEENIRVDYEKLRMLIRKDREFAHDASIIQTIVEQGYITGDLKTGFPAEKITNPDNFVSLLYYFGMLTIDGTVRGKTRLSIPNLVVREQLYTYLLDAYRDNHLSYETRHLSDLEEGLAYDGHWKEYFGYIAECLHRFASQRNKQKGESFVHGFTLALTALNSYYRPVSEQDTQAGYVDLFLMPRIEVYPDMEHSYIIELKYAKRKDSEAVVQQLRKEAIDQALAYAATETVQHSLGTTTLHRIVVVYHGMEMAVCEEV